METGNETKQNETSLQSMVSIMKLVIAITARCTELMISKFTGTKAHLIAAACTEWHVQLTAVPDLA